MGDWVSTWYRDVLMEQAEHYGINLYQGYAGGVKTRFGLHR
jgi:hypothetical protein